LDSFHFDDLIRWLGNASPRRRLLGGLAGSALGLVATRLPDLAQAKKKHKHNGKKARLARNEFGCVDVGGACQGNGSNCCSGLCDGKKPKKGKKDMSACVAHDDAGICFADSDTCTVGQSVPCSADNDACDCVLTTGKAGFCGDFTAGPQALCRDCAKDADCEDEFGAGAACVLLGGVCTPFCPDTGRTACVPPCAEKAT
jgi:hypothetical protein